MFCLFFLLVVSGCAKVIQSQSGGAETPTPIVTIREFPDVPIPTDLKLEEKESFVYVAPGLATGLLVYHGNVEYDSLVRFFDENLIQNGWVLRASLKYPQTLLFYQKESSVCLINIKPAALKMRVEIWLAPIETLPYEPAMP
jgi:hypothetical protein